MTLEELFKWLEARRNEKDFHALKQVRDKCRELLAVKNSEWFKD